MKGPYLVKIIGVNLEVIGGAGVRGGGEKIETSSGPPLGVVV